MAKEEQYFHAFLQRTFLREEKPNFSIEANLTKEQIMWDFIYPIKKHNMILCNGDIYDGKELMRFKVYLTKEKIQLENKPSQLELDKIIHNEAEEVTRELWDESKEILPKEKTTVFSNEVFIVHGHDSNSKLELARMLENDFHLKSIILHEQPNKGNTIIEKLERVSELPGYVFVLLTPDDFGVEDKEPLISLSEKDFSKYKFNYRARQNVILELGYFLGMLPRERVCCLHKGKIDLPSDMAGILFFPFTSSVNECFRYIQNELRNANLIN